MNESKPTGPPPADRRPELNAHGLVAQAESYLATLKILRALLEEKKSLDERIHATMRQREEEEHLLGEQSREYHQSDPLNIVLSDRRILRVNYDPLSKITRVTIEPIVRLPA